MCVCGRIVAVCVAVCVRLKPDVTNVPAKPGVTDGVSKNPTLPMMPAVCRHDR